MIEVENYETKNNPEKERRDTCVDEQVVDILNLCW